MIVTLTLNPSIDTGTSVDRVVAEHKLRCVAPRYEPGGGGINVAKALCRMGKTSTAVFTSGGVFGAHLEELLKAFSFQAMAIPIAGLTRENMIVLETSTNLQFRFNTPGPKLEPSEYQAILKRLSDPALPMDYLVASGTLPEGVPDTFYRDVGELASRRKARFILDTSGPELKAAAGHGVYLLKMNQRELEGLVGSACEDEAMIEGEARRLLNNGAAEIVAVSLAASGAIVIGREGAYRIHAPRVRVESKVGAGDSMVAGMAYALEEGKSLREIALMGVAAGTAAVMNKGTELCSQDQTFKLFEALRRQYT